MVVKPCWGECFGPGSSLLVVSPSSSPGRLVLVSLSGLGFRVLGWSPGGLLVFGGLLVGSPGCVLDVSSVVVVIYHCLEIYAGRSLLLHVQNPL